MSQLGARRRRLFPALRQRQRRWLMTAACDEGDEVACDSLSREEEAKRAWLAKQDVPTWGKAATAFANASSEAAQMAEMTAACDEGDEVACDNLSREEEAKRAWLAKQDVPT